MINLNANMSREELEKTWLKYNGDPQKVQGIQQSTTEETIVLNGKEFIAALGDIELPTGSVKIWNLPDGYEFRDENGNIINAKKIVLEKKKPKYPKSYEECAEILGFKPIHGLALQLVVSSGFSISDTQICAFERNLTTRLEYFRKLLICRDAYWKIAGEEMGLGKPWEPERTEFVFSIGRISGSLLGKILRHNGKTTILEFPTPKMRDAFYENFIDLIEECKELL